MIFAFAASSSASLMPRPWSRMRTTTNWPETPVVTVTGVSGSEKIVAFSRSSASRWAAPRALKPCMCGSTCRSSSTRSYCSISEEAVRTTSDSGIASRRRRPESMPASTRSDSALRRMRVARWSRRNRFARVLGSSSARSRESMNDSWRLRSTWSRRATLTNISAIEPRRAACSWATCDGGRVHRVERGGQLADLVAGRHGDGRERDLRALTGDGHLLDESRQLLADVGGGLGQAAQRDDDPAGDEEGEEQGGHDGRDDDADGDERLGSGRRRRPGRRRRWPSARTSSLSVGQAAELVLDLLDVARDVDLGEALRVALLEEGTHAREVGGRVLGGQRQVVDAEAR